MNALLATFSAVDWDFVRFMAGVGLVLMLPSYLLCLSVQVARAVMVQVLLIRARSRQEQPVRLPYPAWGDEMGLT